MYSELDTRGGASDRARQPCRPTVDPASQLLHRAKATEFLPVARIYAACTQLCLSVGKVFNLLLQRRNNISLVKGSFICHNFYSVFEGTLANTPPPLRSLARESVRRSFVRSAGFTRTTGIWSFVDPWLASCFLRTLRTMRPKRSTDREPPSIDADGFTRLLRILYLRSARCLID